MSTFSSPGGRGYVTVRSAYIPTDQRFSVTASEGFGVGFDGLRALGQFLIDTANEIEQAEAPEAPKKKNSKKAEPAPVTEA